VNLGIEGKVALVTASSKGLGRASAEALAADGAKLVICARGGAALRDAEQAIAAMGADVLAIEADVTQPEQPARLVEATVERFGALDILVPNAGGPPPGRAADVDDQQFLDAINNNLLTSVRLVREALPHMRANGWGRICFITSSSIKQPIPTLTLSNSARTGLWAWAKTLADDVFDDGVTVNTACPGLHNTDRIRSLGTNVSGRVGDPADFGKVVAFLCSDAASFISGTAVLVDGAMSAGLF